MVTISVSSKLAILGLFKTKVFWNKGYGVIGSVHEATNKILLGDSNYSVDVVIQPKFGNSRISIREIIINS